jgi:Flp pilus assembly protein TadD
MHYASFGLVCVLVIGFLVWVAAPELTKSQAKDSYYNLLVQGFRAGQLSVKKEVPPGLAQLADPYDPAVNASYLWNTRDPSLSLLDLSYYQGKLYLYFGVTPALVLFWPYVALTGHYLPEKDAVIFFYALGFLVAAGLMRAVWRRYFPEVSIWVATVGILTLGWITGTLEVLSLWLDVNEVAISCGFAFTMLALAAIWGALHESKRQVLWLLLASLAYGLAIGSRPSLLFGGIILLLPVMRVWRAATESSSRRGVGLLLVAAVGPIMLIGLGLMLYNFLRFDNPFEFGWHYQLAAIHRQTAVQQFSRHYLWFNIRFYFLEPMRWSAHFPFLQAVPLLPVPKGYWVADWVTGENNPYCGILSNYPLMWLALAVPLAWRGRPAGVVSVLRCFVAAIFLFFVIEALTLCFFFAASARYELDFLPALMLLVVIGIFGLERALVGSPVWRRMARWGWSLLLAYLVLFNILEIIETQALLNYHAGNSLLAQGRADGALEHFQKALALRPESAAFHDGLGNALRQKGRTDEAIIEYQKALEIKPDFADADNNLASIFFETGRADKAIFYYQKAIELQPQFIIAQVNLAWILATCTEPSIRNGGRAVALAEQANQFFNNKDPGILRVLAAAYAEAGRFSEAVLTAKQALAEAVTQSNTELTNVLQKEIGLYQSNSPCRSGIE